MQYLLIGDILALAGALQEVAPHQRRALAERLLDEAHAAHKMRRRLGRPHPVWGGGTLMARAMAFSSQAMARAICGDYLSAVVTATEAVRAWKSQDARGIASVLGVLFERDSSCYPDRQRRAQHG